MLRASDVGATDEPLDEPARAAAQRRALTVLFFGQVMGSAGFASAANGAQSGGSARLGGEGSGLVIGQRQG